MIISVLKISILNLKIEKEKEAKVNSERGCEVYKMFMPASLNFFSHSTIEEDHDTYRVTYPYAVQQEKHAEISIQNVLHIQLQS